MVLDEELLKKARAEGVKLAEAERQSQLARAEYHTAIRRLHLASGSLREVAEALSLSHQRVQQIVRDAGGSWWQRVWRSRTVRRDAVCTFCERPPSEVAKLVAGPNVYICDGCITRAERARHPAKHRCSFCGKTRPSHAVDDAAVCAECLQLCRQIADGRSG
jgi:hypothetical protein